MINSNGKLNGSGVTLAAVLKTNNENVNQIITQANIWELGIKVTVRRQTKNCILMFADSDSSPSLQEPYIVIQ